MDNSTLLLIGLLVSSIGFPAIYAGIYKLFFHKDTEPHRKEINELKERHQDEKIARIEDDLDALKKKSDNNLIETNKKHQEFEVKFVELSSEFKAISTTMKNIEKQLTEIINHNKVSKIN